MNATETRIYGPVNLSVAALSVLAYVGHSGRGGGDEAETRHIREFLDEIDDPYELNEKLEGYEGFGLEDDEAYNSVVNELLALVEEWGDDYSLDRLYELNGTGLRTHMRADELEIGRKFETGEDGGSGTTKIFRRLGNPFVDDVVDGMIASKVSNAYDGTRGNTVKIPADQIVRPVNQELTASDNYVAGKIPTPEEVVEGKRRWQAYLDASGAIDQRVNDYVGKDNHVHYSANPRDDDDIPVDNLDEVAVDGKVIFVAEGDEFYGGDESSDYQSPVLENPTWLELCKHFNDQIKTTGDYHHIFFEGVYKTKKNPIEGVPVYRFATGS
jgi:hypothetical protein